MCDRPVIQVDGNVEVGEMLPGKLSALLCCYRAEAVELSLTLMRCYCVQLQKQPEQTLQIYLKHNY